MAEPVLQVKHLKKYFTASAGIFASERRTVKAVDDVSFDVYPGETIGLVGESGCGKTTLGRTIVNLINATEGEVIFQGKDISKLSDKEMSPIRKDMQIVFQDPYGSLNGRMSIGSLIREPMQIHKMYDRAGCDRKVKELLESVGLRSYFANRYPHEFSGGQRQRIAIAKALATDPSFIVLDEPVSALDVSVQSQVLNLLAKLRKERQLTYLFISHDLSVVRFVSDRVAVMYLGAIVEMAEANELYDNHKHPYTEALLSAMPDIHSRGRKEKKLLEGDVPSPINLPKGCRFHTRCKYAKPECKEVPPELTEVSPGHFVACHCR